MSTINFSYDPEWLDTLSAPFMTNAFIAGLCIALAAGVMGYFTIARRSTFAAHALAHIGLPGATGAVLLGLPVSLGMGVFALGGALVIGALGKRVSEREIATGTVLAFATGLGLFFARLSSSASQQMQSILFGSILTITTGQIIGFAVFDVLLLALLAIIYRPLLFSSLDEQVAQAKGVPIGLMNVAFMAIMAGVITIAVPAVGTLLIFALVITPAATANILAGSPFKAMVIASVLCLVSIWAGLVLSAMFPAPPSFIIVTLSTLFWAIAKAVEAAKKNLVKVPVLKGTIPHDQLAKFGGALVYIKPASPGTGVKAGGAMRAVLESVGITDVLAKSKGSSNPHNLVKATIAALCELRDAATVAQNRGISVEKVFKG